MANFWGLSWGSAWGSAWGSPSGVVAWAASEVVRVQAAANFTVVVSKATQNIWDTDQGVARNAFVKFTPMQDAEVRLQEQRGSFGWAAFAPYARAAATPEFSTAVSGHARFWWESGATASIVIPPATASSGSVTPKARGIAALIGGTVAGVAGTVVPEASSVAQGLGDTATTDTGVFYPWGVRNPSDEELMMLVVQARRARTNLLTRKQVDDIRRV